MEQGLEVPPHRGAQRETVSGGEERKDEGARFAVNGAVDGTQVPRSIR